MKRDAKATDRAPMIVTRRLGGPRPRIEITPTADQYRQLCRDLARLRAQGAASNTAAILDAVHLAAAGPILGEDRAKAESKRVGTRVGG